MSSARRKDKKEKGPQPRDNAVRGSKDHSPRFLVFCLSVGLALTTSIAFFPALRNNFVNFDDNTYVYENPKVVAGLTRSGIIWAFTHFHSSNWHPLTWLSHMLDCQLYRLNAGGHHFTSVLLHAVVAILLFIVLQEMTGAIWRPAFVAAVFAIHPLRVESVAWISERKDILCGLFFMLTLAAYAKHARSPSLGRYLVVVLLYASGLMCKPMLVSLPLVLLLIDYWPLRRLTDLPSARRLFIEKLPLIGLAGLSCFVTLFAQQSTTVSIDHIPLAWRVGNAAVACMIYIVQMVWPLHLAPFYPHPADEQLAPGVTDQLPAWQIVLAIVAIVGISIAAVLRRRERPYVFTGWFWYLIMLGPVIGIVQVGLQAHADRYTYLPQIGLYILVSWSVAHLVAWRRAGGRILTAAAAIVLVSLTLIARAQVRYWHDSETLWKHSLAVTEDNDFPHFGLGDVYFARGELDKAIAEFRSALYLRPHSPYAHNDIGLVFAKMGQLDEAVDHFNAAIRILPILPTVHYNLGNALLQRGQTDDAIKEFERQLALQPDHAPARCNLAIALLNQGQLNQAIAQYERTIELRPDYAEAYYGLGNCYLEQGNPEKAAQQYEQALKLSPRLIEARNNLATILCQKGEIDRAISELEEAIRIQPDNIDALNNLTWILAMPTGTGSEKRVKALPLAQRLQELVGNNNPKVLRTIAAAYAANGKLTEALDVAEQGLKLARGQADAALAEALEADLSTYRMRIGVK
jgi:tetratricopeptide (TPR) repeat protein